MKLTLSGDCDHFVFENILDGLKLTPDQFLRMCILAGCDYLESVKGVGINRAFALILTDNLFKSLADRGHQQIMKKILKRLLLFLNIKQSLTLQLQNVFL